jgi:hypothetical protein
MLFTVLAIVPEDLDIAVHRYMPHGSIITDLYCVVNASIVELDILLPWFVLEAPTLG